MSREITDLLPAVRLAAAGVPPMLATYALTRALSEFLDRSESWKEWGTTASALLDASDGYLSWANATATANSRVNRIKRIDKLRIVEDGTEIKAATVEQLYALDTQWRTRAGPRPTHFVVEGEGDGLEGHQIRLYPIPADDNELTVIPRFILVTDATAEFDLDEYDDDIPSIPDRIFYAFREAITSGALAHLFCMPNKDWTHMALFNTHTSRFEAGIVAAKSRADRDFSNAPLVASYGGIW